ncbi:MAG: hypothetical protein AB7P69_16235 [Candidatus Binatia bacterium]
MTDETKEQIKLETEVFRFLVIIGIALGGGTLGILTGLPSGIRLLLAGVGILATLIVGYVAWLQYRKIKALIGGIPQ